jgi:uncharacterized RDD family membrane protein YckC
MNSPTKVIGRRIGAFLIDWLILQVVNFALFFALAESDTEVGAKVLTGDYDADATAYGNITIGDTEYSLVDGRFVLWLAIVLLLAWLYHGVLQGLTGWTPGKRLVGIRTVREDTGREPGVGRATVRWVLWIVDSLPWLIPYIVGLVTAAATSKNQRVGDMVAKTLVVRQEAMGQPIQVGAGYGGAAGYGQGAPQGAQAQPAGWHPDPHGQARLRYWDGSSWTEHTSE